MFPQFFVRCVLPIQTASLWS